jgi:hypothetical protein
MREDPWQAAHGPRYLIDDHTEDSGAPAGSMLLQEVLQTRGHIPLYESDLPNSNGIRWNSIKLAESVATPRYHA